MRVWKRIHEDSSDFGSEFARIHETLGEDSPGFARCWEMICETLGDDLQGFIRICEDWHVLAGIHENSQDFGRGFLRIHGTLAEDS